MKSSPTLVVLAVLALSASACQQTPVPVAAPTISETDAGKIADATVAAWTSMDAARIKALYAPSVAGFDFSYGPLETDRATWDKAQDVYASEMIDSAEQKARKIQILGSDVFVVSGMWDVKSSSTPANNGAVRCTDVYQKDAAGNWSIINEHCSAVPKAA